MRLAPLLLALLPTLLSAQSATPLDGARSHPAAPLRTEPKVLWETKTGYRDSGAFTLVSGVLVTGNINGRGGVFGYDAATGRRLWAIPNHMRGGPSTDGTSAYVVNDTREGYIFRLLKLDPKTGRILWSAGEYDFGNHDAAPLPAEGRVFLLSRNRTLSAFDAASGKPLWKLPAPRICAPELAYANGTLYLAGGVGERQDTLTALDPATGRVLWSASPKSAAGSPACAFSPALANGLLLTLAGNELQAFDAATGAPKWQRALPSRAPLYNLALSNGIAYTGSPLGFHGFRIESGQPAFEAPFPLKPSGAGLPLLTAGGVLYFAGNAELPPDSTKSRTGWIYALDLASKTILWKHHASRVSQYDPDGTWSNQHMLPTPNGLFYETQGLLVRLGQ